MSAAKLARTALKIPKHIERGPTDILKALASTVKFGPQNPRPCFQDDPFFVPVRPFETLRFAQYKLSGRKAAKYFLNKYPELFYRDDSEPKIESFQPAEEFNSEMDLTEEDLKWCIENADPINGAIAYETIQAKGLKLDNEVLLQFLEMLCFKNDKEATDLIDAELEYFGSTMNEETSWAKNGLASKIFEQIKGDVDPSRVYSAMIAGVSKFRTHAMTEKLFLEFCELHPGKALYLEAYDGILRSSPVIKSSAEEGHQSIDRVVEHMAKNLVKPNLAIFNSILESYRHFIVTNETYEKSIQLLNDMSTLNIKHSLGTYRGFMNVLYRCKNKDRLDKDSVNVLFHEMLDYINADDQFLEVRDDRDVKFLDTIMKLVAERMNDVSVAHKLHKIYLKNPNLFIYAGQSFRYLNHYFSLIVTTESLANIIKFYKTYVPLNFRPSADVYEALAEALETYGADREFIDLVGKHIIDFGLFKYVKNDAIFRKNEKYVEELEAKMDRAKKNLYR